jgi:hypothetical protein
MKNYQGDIIEESLENKEILKKLAILSTRIEKVNEEHKTPWLSQWTLHAVEINEGIAQQLAEELSQSLKKEHGWYIDYRNDNYHFVIFKDKVFKLDRSKKDDYDKMIKYGLSIGTPSYQLPNFSDL